MLSLWPQRLDLNEGEVLEALHEKGWIEEHADGMSEAISDPFEQSILLANEALFLLGSLFAGIAGEEAGLA